VDLLSSVFVVKYSNPTCFSDLGSPNRQKLIAYIRKTSTALDSGVYIRESFSTP